MYGFVHMNCNAYGDQRRAPDPLELVLQAVMGYQIWILCNSNRSS